MITAETQQKPSSHKSLCQFFLLSFLLCLSGVSLAYLPSQAVPIWLMVHVVLGALWYKSLLKVVNFLWGNGDQNEK
jgi:integral membrane sensor domain MASE1